MTDPFFVDNAQIAERVVWSNQNHKSQCSIAKVMAVNSSPVSVDIQPLVNYFDQIAGFTPYIVIPSVPVVQLQTSAYSINTPLNIGDTGLVIWFDREVYTTLQAGATTPQAPSSGDLYDVGACVFLPILTSFALANPLKTNGVDFISSQVSLLTQLLNLLTGLSTFLTAVASAPTTNPLTPAYAAAIALACNNFLSLGPVLADTVTVIKAQLTLFQGMQT
jgi:hypothetical protein